ncbi:TRADD-N-associated membrane domain-containing protein [Streptomyces ossamyceticus]|uniref:Cyanobacterial TRADD-N associated 2 transmembrane domain-containing protein n=1 Tax=Streptomyces ossamyceticus TaxID=249581 RepID=A0ABV2V126_9ACTN
MTGKASGIAYQIAGIIGAQLARQAGEALVSRGWRTVSQSWGELKADRVLQVQNVFIEQPKGLAEKRQDFQFAFLNHTLKQSDWTFRLSVGFKSGGAVIILAGAALALVHAGKPDRSYVPLVTGLTGALLTSGGGVLAKHSERARTNLAKAAESNENKIDDERNLEVAMTFIDRVEDPQERDRLNSAAAMKALGLETKPETMVDRLLPGEQPKEIDPGGLSG